MKKVFFTVVCIFLYSFTLFAQQEYTHPTTGCGISYYYDFKGNRVLRQFNCLVECPCPQMPDCNCNQSSRIAKKTTIIKDSVAEASIKIYPNPTLEKFSIEFAENDIKAQVTVVSSLGQQITTQLVTCKRVEYSLYGLAAGTYYILVNKNNQITKYKVVKIND